MTIHGERTKLINKLHKLLDITEKDYNISGIIVKTEDYYFLYKMNYQELVLLEKKLFKLLNDTNVSKEVIEDE